jgi:hypothetical protein
MDYAGIKHRDNPASYNYAGIIRLRPAAAGLRRDKGGEMKISCSIFMVVLCVANLFPNDILQPAQKSKDFKYQGYIKSKISTLIREKDPPPNYSFIFNGNGEPTTFLIDSYYDYMPYGYHGHSIRLQPEISFPHGYPAEGIYIVYYCSETQNIFTNRRGFYSYINPDGTLLISSVIANYTVEGAGLPTVDIDPVTADPLFTWYAAIEADESYDCIMTYDIFHLAGITGYWKAPFIVIDNPEVGEMLTGHYDDEFIFPIVWIGDSPVDEHRRAHIYASNITSNSVGNHNYNTLHAFADFNADSLLYELEFDWTYRTFPYMDHLHYDDIDRVTKDMVVNDNGQIAFFGSYGDTLFCLYSDDWGENFTWFKQEWLYPVENPLWEDGVTYQFYDNDEITPSVLFFTLSYDGTHYNGVFSEDNSKILWMTGINLNTDENIESECYMPALFWPDIETGTFSFYDMDIQGADPADDQPAIPWDLDEDGEVDEFYDDGSVYIPLSMCSWFYNSDQGYQDAFYHENNFKMTAYNNWIVAAWHDCKKLYHAYFEEEGYEGWYQQPEIAISISDDCGETWSEIRYINANPNDAVIDEENHYEGNYAPEFEDMLPVNITLGEKLEILSNEPGNYHAKLHFAFFDDNDYGSAAGPCEDAGQLNGGRYRVPGAMAGSMELF